MDSSQRVAQIYATGARLFSQYGYHGTTIRQMAAALDLQGGSLYAHIHAKEDVLWGIVVHAADEFFAAVMPIVQADLPAAEKLRAALRAHVGVVAANLDAATVYFHDWKFLSPERRAAIRARRDEYEGLFRAIVAEGVRAGAFRPLDDKFAALLVLSVGNWLYQWYRADGPLSPDAVADAFADLILAGMQRNKQLVFDTLTRELGQEVERRGLTEEELMQALEATKREVVDERYGGHT